mmetsp:Transcript_16496/g.24344  ORF Transcript_16496/g.24344 Transcript_16496/m.24344 type:complete len:323 (+) Transcript_16496:92-1060(+)|eukprot:CAMPEP_0194211972 /NCGR_PEP_ID=MMETSP0156-20130528/11418_1 /TAXON_ID=33649 /ORGANISM="Thalassionema nitzschioides, Strain L26-B" /LENGTH=322 /DNA_ID=CAMNT_0038939665 /DNA_START=33 /DNA_END=1001 /DNA_ORIENTATION=+
MANYVDDERFDGLYLNVAQSARGIEPLLDTVFSFLRRKTDFFSGPPGSGENGTDMAIQKVNDVLMKHAEIYKADKLKKQKSKSKPKSKTTPQKVLEDVVELGADGVFDISPSEQASEKELKNEPSSPEKNSNDSDQKSETTKEGEDETKAPPPLGNGGTVEGKYVWTQTLSEVNVTVSLPEGTRGRDLNVTIARNHLKVGIKRDNNWIINGSLVKSTISDDSFWTIEDGNRLVLNLQKLNQMEWWEGVVDGDPTIDVRTIQPENSNLADLDGETRQTVEKMMFDQRQKAAGLPTSDEQKKFEMLENFKKAHPEMDFSNAKIS